MSEQQETVARGEPACPFQDLSFESQVIRRQDLLDLGEAFKAAFEPLSVIVSHMQEQNRRLELVSRWLFVISAGAVLGAGFHVWTLFKVHEALLVLEQNTTKLLSVQGQVIDAAAELSKLKRTALATEAKVERVEQRAQREAKVELVPEKDPVRALRAPVLLRLVPPPATSQASPFPGPASPSASTVLIPLRAESLQ